MHNPKKISNPVVPLRGLSAPNYEIVFMTPRSFGEMTQAIQALRECKIVILNLTALAQDLAQRAADFVSGGTEAIAGHQTRLGKNVFMFTPQSIQIHRVETPVDSARASSWRPLRSQSQGL